MYYCRWPYYYENPDRHLDKLLPRPIKPIEILAIMVVGLVIVIIDKI